MRRVLVAALFVGILALSGCVWLGVFDNTYTCELWVWNGTTGDLEYREDTQIEASSAEAAEEQCEGFGSVLGISDCRNCN